MTDDWIDDIERRTTSNRWSRRADARWEEGKQRQHEIERQVDQFEQSLHDRQLPPEWRPMDEGNRASMHRTPDTKQTSPTVAVLLVILMLCFVAMAIANYILVWKWAE